MKYSLTDELALLIAHYLDFQGRCLSVRNTLAALAGDPRLSQHRRWMGVYLKNKAMKQKLHSALSNLKRRGCLQEKIFGHTRGYVFSPKGATKIFNLKIMMVPKKEKLPEGRWLMVFFDVPEKMRKMRDGFRAALLQLGFEQMQKSVWVTSYRVERELQEAIKMYTLEKYARPLMVREL